MALHRFVFAALVALALATGCAYGELVCPQRGGEPWYEVSSKNFVLRTNLSKDEARKRSHELEKMHHALAHVMELDFPMRWTQTDPIEILHFAHHEQLDQFTGREFGGFMTKQDGLVTIAASEGSGKKSRDDLLLHELAHRFVAHQLSTYPQWLTEGLAGFFESLQVRDGRARVGLLPASYRSMWFGNSSDAPSVRELREMARETFYERKTRRANYFAAWRLVHFLSNSSPDMNRRFHAYAGALVRGVAEERAWEETFGAPEAIESQVREYRGSRNVITWNADYEPPKMVEPAVRKLSDGEVHIVWARMSKLSFPSKPEQQVRNERRLHDELADARAHDPSWPGSTYWHLELADEGSSEERLEKMRAHVEENPDDARALRRLVEWELRRVFEASSEELGDSRSAAIATIEPLVRRLVDEAVYGRDFDLIARFYALTQNPEKGIDFGLRAVKRAPSCVSCFDTLALLLYQNGEFQQAFEIQKRATELYGEKGEVPAMVLERLRFYERAAQSATPGA